MVESKIEPAPGDYLEVELREGKVILTPKALIEKRIAEGLENFRMGRTHGPFASAKDAIRFLHSEVKKRKKSKAS